MIRALVLLTILFMLSGYYIQREHGSLGSFLTYLDVQYQLSMDDGESELGSQMEGEFASYELPPIEQVHLIRLLRARDFATLESLLQTYFDEFSKDVRYEGKVIGAFNVFGFEKNILDEVEEWSEQFPDSYFARVAKGKIYYDLAWKARGNKYSSETFEVQFKDMNYYFDLAEHELKDALEGNSKLSSAYCLLVYMAAASSRKEEKNRWYKEGIKQIPYSYNIRGCYVEKLRPIWGGSYEEMENFIERSLIHKDNNPRLLLLSSFIPYYKAGAYRRDKEYEKSILEITKSINYVKRWYNYYRRAKSYIDVGEYELALADINSALEARPDAFGPLRKEGYILTELGRYEEAMDVFNHAVSLYKTKYEIYQSRARLFWALEEYDKAHQDLLKAIEINPKSAYAWKRKGILNHYHLNNSEQAIKDLTIAVGLDSDPSTWYELSSTLWHMKDQAAVPAYKSFLDFCLTETCKRVQVEWASKFIACVNQEPSCTWRKDFYANWVE